MLSQRSYSSCRQSEDGADISMADQDYDRGGSRCGRSQNLHPISRASQQLVQMEGKRGKSRIAAVATDVAAGSAIMRQARASKSLSEIGTGQKGRRRC
jgi:hypothetical protein